MSDSKEMSFWGQQPIARDQAEPQIIKPEPASEGKWDLQNLGPDFALLRVEETSHRDVNDFLLKNNFVAPTTTTLMSESLFSYLRNRPDSVWLVLTYKSKIIATCFAIIFNLTLSGQRIRTAHTIYLCVRKDFSGHGLAARLIQKTIVSVTNNEIYVGYHQVNKPIGINAIKVENWWYPIKPRGVTPLGFTLPVKGSHETIRKYFALPKSEIVLVPFTDHLDFVQKEWERFPAKMVWEEFLDFLQSCPGIQAYVACQLGKPLSLIAWRNWDIYFDTIKKITPIAMIEFFTSPRSDILKTVIERIESPLVYFHQVGDLTKEFFESIHAVPSGARYVNWYNWTGQYKPEDFFLPFL